MQTQDAPAEFLFKLWPWLETNKNRLLIAAAAIIVAVGVGYFVSAQHDQKEVDAGQALTKLLVTPPSGTATVATVADSLAKLAVDYSGTAAGQRAQLQAAASYFSLGRYADAQAQFQKFLDGNPTGSLAASAQLGVAASLEAQGKPDDAAANYQKVASNFPGTAGALSAECALGRIAEAQGKLSEALNHFDSAAHAGSMGGSLAQEAQQHYFEIKAKLAAAAPKPAATISK